MDPTATAQFIESPENVTPPDFTNAEMPPLWDLDANFPMAIEPLLTELKESPTHTDHSSLNDLAPKGDMKLVQTSDDGQMSALMRDDVYVWLGTPEQKIFKLTCRRVSVYFERVHPNIPIIHKQRYFDMLEQPNPTKGQMCLQLAVQATAAASTAQMLRSSDSLYAEACTALEAVEINGPIGLAGVPVELEYIQALLLVVYYEILRMPQHKCILTSGRAFRLIQISRLHDIDMDTISIQEVSGEVFAREEERRRTFWLAYCFDRLFSIRYELPHTLHEEAVSISPSWAWAHSLTTFMF